MLYGVDKMTVKISNWSGAADTFTLPYNPIAYDDSVQSNHEITNISFQRHHILVSGGGIIPKSIILTGHFSGASKRTYYRNLAKHFQETTKLKKLYFESDKFALGVGRSCKQTNAGGRTNFIDYVANFESIIGILLGDTEKTSGTNAGDVTTFVTEITGTVTSGASDIVLTDAFGNQVTIPSSALTTGQAIVYKLVQMVDSGSGIYVSEYAYVTIAGTQTRTVQTTGGFGLLQLAAAANITTVTTTNLTNPVKKFRDGWSD